MQRLIDTERFQFGVDGLREAGFGKPDNFRAPDVEEAFQISRRIVLDDRIIRKVF